jgi:nitrogen fixation-related uncharacterized protein
MSTIDSNSNPNFYQFDDLSGEAYNVLAELGEDVPNPKKRSISLFENITEADDNPERRKRLYMIAIY